MSNYAIRIEFGRKLYYLHTNNKKELFIKRGINNSYLIDTKEEAKKIAERFCAKDLFYKYKIEFLDSSLN